jgi:hypothetical protein
VKRVNVRSVNRLVEVVDGAAVGTPTALRKYR